MGQSDLVSGGRIVQGQVRYPHALAASLALHGGLVATIVGLSCLWQPHLFIVHNGSAPGATVVSLETIEIVAPPSQPPPLAPAASPTPKATALATTPTTAPAPTAAPAPSPQLATRAQTQPVGVPVLAGPVARAIPAAAPKSDTASHKIASSPATLTGVGHFRPASGKYVASYTPGTSLFPHPPYPPEARDLQQTGVVRMMIQFDIKGDVSEAEVSTSSGVAILDSETRAYVREHWHSHAYAGQAVSVPVEYTLTSL